MNYWEMLKAISPYDYSIVKKLTNHTEFCGDVGMNYKFGLYLVGIL